MGVETNTAKFFWITLFQNFSFLAPVLTLFYLQRGLSYSQIFILYIVIVVSMFLSEIPTGVLGDKFGRKTSIVCGCVGWVIFSIGLFFVTSFWGFFVLFVLWGLNATFFSGSDEALIYDSLKQIGKENEMKKHMGRIYSAAFIPSIIIAPMAAIIAKDLTNFQFNLLIFGNLLFYIAVFFISLSLVEPESKTKREIVSPLEILKSAIKHIKSSPKLLRIFLNKTLIFIPGSIVFGLLWQPYLKDSGVPVAIFGILIAVASLMIFFMSRNLDKIEKHVSGKMLILATGLLPFLAFLVGAFFHNILAAIIFYFVIKLAVSIRDPVFSQYLNEHIESHNRATVLSSLSMIDSFFDAVIFLSVGFITDLGLNYAFLFCAGILLIALIFFRVTNEHIKVKA